ncbi:MAG: DUF1638 domain-containing protein [Candidatus Hydrogenedentes bacterium]|nr:DUF1638 domain-containing protein [Candidatus Hydrogenedentota bacterium]
MARYKLIACHVLWREFCHFASQGPNTIEFEFLEQGLHNTPDILRDRLQAAIDATDNKFDAVLIGYALCSNGIVGLTARHTPLVFLRGHDCITFLLGSKERYREYFDAHPGTYWYSPGWIDDTTMPGIDRYNSLLKQYVDTYGEENADFLMRMEQQWFTHYSNAAYVDLGFAKQDAYVEYTRECAKWLGWNCDTLKGDPRLVIHMLEGRWNDDDFLVLHPGESVALTYDERIIEARKPNDGVFPPK